MSFGTPGNSGNSTTKRRSLGMTRRRTPLAQDNTKSKLFQRDKDNPSSTSKCHNIQMSNTPVRTKLIAHENVQSSEKSSNSRSEDVGQSQTLDKSLQCQAKTLCQKSCETPFQSPSGNARARQINSPYVMNTPTSTSTNRSRTNLHRSHRKRFKADFTSPSTSASGSRKAVTDEGEEVAISILQGESARLQQEIVALQEEGLDEAELQVHMKKMHEYNELKDMGQMLIGKIALIEGVTTKELYDRFGLDLED